MNKSLVFLILLTLLPAGVWAGNAGCKGTVLNPVTDICWDCMFPVRVGSVESGSGEGAGVAPGKTDPPACACPTAAGNVIVGLNYGFWEHSRLIEVTKDPLCFPSLGTGMTPPKPGFGAGEVKGGNRDGSGDHAAFNLNYIVFPVWQIMSFFTDFPCTEHTDYDIAYISWTDPMWLDDELALIINPEAAGFGTPVLQLACPVDTAWATVREPVDELFWCIGSWGSMYPMTGNFNESNEFNASAGAAARFLYKLNREMVLRDTSLNSCSRDGVLTPVLYKSHYRLQIARPVRGNQCIPFGRPSMIWGDSKNPPWGAGQNSSNNFLYVLTRARMCCVGYKVGL